MLAASEQHGSILIERFLKMLRGKKDAIGLSASKKKLLIDFLSCLPEMMRRRIAPAIARDEIARNRRMDEDSKSCPEWSSMIRAI